MTGPRPLRTAAAWLGVLACLGGQAAAQRAPAPEPTAHPLLWRIDGIRPSYVYGTLHVADKRVLALPGAVVEALEGSGALFTEIPTDMETVRGSLHDLLLPPGETLESVLPPDLCGRLDRYFRSRGTSLRPFQRLKPWAVTVRATMMQPPNAEPGDKPLDLYLVELAEENGTTVDALETMTEQIGIFESLSHDEHLEWLRSTLTRLEAEQADGANPAERLIELYLAGDEEAIHRYLLDALPGDGEPGQKLTEKLLEQRNLLMSKRIADKLRTDGTRGYFFAVGAGHLAGTDGLLALLAEAGFRLKRIGAPGAVEPPVELRSMRELELEAEVEDLKAEVRRLKRRIQDLEQEKKK